MSAWLGAAIGVPISGGLDFGNIFSWFGFSSNNDYDSSDIKAKDREEEEKQYSELKGQEV